METVEAMVALARVIPDLSAEETYLFGVEHDIGALAFASQSGDDISQWALHHGSEISRLLEDARTALGLEHGVVAFMRAAYRKPLHWRCAIIMAILT